MSVSKAAQVISKSLANGIEQEFGDAVSETILFLRVFDKWFDVLNTSDLYTGYFTRNVNLNPYKTPNDQRLKWLNEDFLNYLKNWEKDVNERINSQGEQYPKEQRNKMLLSRETLSGLKQTTKAMLEIVPFLLSKGAKFILTANFNQDPLEHEFSRHRQAIGSGENPSIYQYTNNQVKLRLLKEGNIKIKSSGANTTNLQ